MIEVKMDKEIRIVPAALDWQKKAIHIPKRIAEGGTIP